MLGGTVMLNVPRLSGIFTKRMRRLESVQWSLPRLCCIARNAAESGGDIPYEERVVGPMSFEAGCEVRWVKGREADRGDRSGVSYRKTGGIVRDWKGG